MLKIKNKVISEISNTFLSCRNEQGFLLGSEAELTQLDCCQLLPASRSGMYFYEPNPFIADKMIQDWGRKGICFCGLIHSHVVNKEDLSENDIAFAKQLFIAYNLPVLWFGIGVVHDSVVDFYFYSISGNSGEIAIFPVNTEIII